MKKSLIASLMLPALLTGCGSSSSGSSAEVVTPIYYTWQIVQLVTRDATTALAGGCAIYADSEDDEVVTAIVATDNYNILYHDADGSITATYSADDYIDGEVIFDANDIEEGGYVSLEEVDGLVSSRADVYMFSVGKSLFSDLVINVIQTQDSNNSCIIGDDYRSDDDSSDIAAISVNQPSSRVDYYQTSYGYDAVSGQDFASDITVISPLPATHDVLVTAFDDYDATSEEKTNLSYYKFLDPSYVYEYDSENDIDEYATSGTLTNANLINLTWDVSDYDGNSVTADVQNVYAIHDELIYFWQPLYASEELTVPDSDTLDESWTSYFTGDESGWDFEAFVSIDSASDVNLTLPSLASMDSVGLEQYYREDDPTAYYRVDTAGSFTSDDYVAQRTHVRMIDSSNNTIYQSIYAAPNDSQILLDNSQYDLVDCSADKIEINLVRSDVTDTDNAVQYVMDESLDKVALADSLEDLADYHDANGFVASGDQSDALQLAMFESTTLVVKSAN